MAEYSFQCLICAWTETVSRLMKDGPPADLEHCGQPMIRKYRPIRAVAFNPYQLLLDWNEENYRRMRARHKGKRAERFSPDHVKAPGAGLPMKDWKYRSRAYEQGIIK